MKRTLWVAVGLLAVAAPVAAQPAGANYDEAKVPAYVLPDPLRFVDGRPVTAAGEWPRRREEVLALFRGTSTAAAPGRRRGCGSSWSSRPTRARRARDAQAGAGPARRFGERPCLRDPPLRAERGARPVPAFLGLNFDGNHAVHPDPGIRLSSAWMGEGPGVAGNRATEAARGTNAGSWPVERILDRGYALATVYYGDLEPDHPDGWKDGVRARTAPAPPAASPPVTGARSAPGPGA